MSIAYEINLSKHNIGSFSELIPAVMEQAMKIGLTEKALCEEAAALRSVLFPDALPLPFAKKLFTHTYAFPNVKKI